ncbi:hypothetical protein EDC01DRAFT_245789 [Geopyxis carbonaria]|nr:hypothetical protein EDC01DRAFT_245789 [Geopyxis carbonaria]
MDESRGRRLRSRRGESIPPRVSLDLEGGRATTSHGQHEQEQEKERPLPLIPTRSGFHPLEACVIAFRGSCKMSMAAHALLPAVPLGIVLHFVKPEWHTAVFIANYIAMIPNASLLSFASQELARKVYRPVGVLLEAAFAAAVEIILCLLLLFQHQYQVIQAALLGSMLANLLLCTGMCFIVGGIGRVHNTFDEMVTETSGGLVLISVAGLVMPTVFEHSIRDIPGVADMERRLLGISRFTAILLLCAYAAFICFQLFTHHSFFDEMLKESERHNEDRIDAHRRPKLTTLEALVFVAVFLALVTMSALFMVQQIHWIVTHHAISDAFVGLILVPLVEKAAEHLTALDEAYDDAMSFALSHLLLGPVQTALLVAPVVVCVGWVFKLPMDLGFETFLVVSLVFAVLVVGNFIKDNKSNYLEGALLVIFYVIIAAGTWYYPNPQGLESH